MPNKHYYLDINQINYNMNCEKKCGLSTTVRVKYWTVVTNIT